jgi:hypothetical protein
VRTADAIAADVFAPARPILNVFLRWYMVVFLILLLSLHSGLHGTCSDYDAHAYALWLPEIAEYSTRDFLERLAVSGLCFYSSSKFQFETGFALITFIITRFSSSLEYFFFCIAAISIAPKLYVIRRLCPASTLSVA